MGTGWNRTLRIWNNDTRLEVACLSHNSQVIAIAWLDGDAGVMALSEDGVLGKWTRLRPNEWEWGRLLNVGPEKHAPEDMVCLAYARDRIAVAFPRSGVKVWMWYKGSWLAQRSIMRTNVTALKFIDSGDALLGGTREGAVWHCAVPNGTMRVYAFLQSSITSIDINPTGTHALIAQKGGSACLVSLGSHDEKRVRTSYLDADLQDGALGGVFAAKGTTVVFGAVEESLLVWDTQRAAIVYGMQHEDGEISCLSSLISPSCNGAKGCVITGTRQGQLTWWPQPPEQGTCATHFRGVFSVDVLVVQSPPSASRKRAKVR
ncbi:WD40-repeat-containing domain protein [Mycena maculata]|uniref:WD40-repeat-containing domain protein n=1 Tax=Mycena maculata TaxID=230809 RepID=A0AAD7K7G2_9AGAR|nr:WD40-repeat-containing domain protein [Mycena maculata]